MSYDYDSKKEYYKRLERLSQGCGGEWAGVNEAADREWIKNYRESESWNNMGGI